MEVQRQWLEAVPWQTVLTLNQTLCQAQNMSPQIRADKCDLARRLWEASTQKRGTLADALDVLKKCYDLGPFLFNNGNTFAALAKTLVEDWLRTLSPLEAQIIRNTVGHYVAGLVGRKELQSVLTHFEATWKESKAPGPTAPEEKPAVVAPPLGAQQAT